MNVVVVRDGGVCENEPVATARTKFRRIRDVVYARRGLKRYGLQWKGRRNPITGIVGWRLVAGPIVAEARDAGLMSFCRVTVDDRPMGAMFKEEEFAGHGGIDICVLRGTQHVLQLIEMHVHAAVYALGASTE